MSTMYNRCSGGHIAARQWPGYRRPTAAAGLGST